MQLSLNVGKEVQHEFNGLVDSMTLLRILNTFVEVPQQGPNARVRLDVVPVRHLQDFVMFDEFGFPCG